MKTTKTALTWHLDAPTCERDGHTIEQLGTWTGTDEAGRLLDRLLVGVTDGRGVRRVVRVDVIDWKADSVVGVVPSTGRQQFTSERKGDASARRAAAVAADWLRSSF